MLLQQGQSQLSSSNVITYNKSAAAMQGLCNKLKHHWTNIAHHLYLKADAPVPLPTVGPLAELLNVSNCPPVQAVLSMLFVHTLGCT